MDIEYTRVKKWLGYVGVAVGAIGAGATLMYFLDPERGAYRRANFRSRVTRQGRELSNTVMATLPSQWQNGISRAAPFAHSLGEAANDAQINQRLRFEVARYAGVGSDVDVAVNNGHVYLRGWAPPKVAHKLAKRAKSISGVRAVENHIAMRA